MKMEIGRSEFHDLVASFKGHGFSYEAISTLFDHLNEADFVANACDIASDFCEYSVADAINDYGDRMARDYTDLDDGEREVLAREFFTDCGALIGETPRGFVVRNSDL